MNDELQRVSDWLDSHAGKLLIRKKELMIGRDEVVDLDEIELNYNKMSLGENERKDPDDYVAKQALLLHGDGTITGEERIAPLPMDAYEIPLLGDYRVESTDHSLTIRTERAIYEIEPTQ